MNEASKRSIAGIEWCDEISNEMLDRLENIPLVEFIPENFFDHRMGAHGDEFLGALKASRTPVIVHFVGLSMASIEGFKEAHFDKALELSRDLNVISMSDHLCLTQKNGRDVGQLTTAAYNDQVFDVIATKLEKIAEKTSTPFALENIAHNFVISGMQYSETEFINKLTSETGMKLLLDFNNIYGNGVNFGINPKQYIDELDLSHLDSIHLAGGFFDQDGMLQDGHCERVPPPVWELYQYGLQRAGFAVPTIVERTGNNEQEGLTPIYEDMLAAQRILNDFDATIDQAERLGGVA